MRSINHYGVAVILLVLPLEFLRNIANYYRYFYYFDHLYDFCSLESSELYVGGMEKLCVVKANIPGLNNLLF